MRKKKQKQPQKSFGAVCKDILFTIKAIHRHTPGFFSVSFFNAAFLSASDATVWTLMIKWIFDAIGKGVAFSEVLVLLLIMVGIAIATRLFDVWYSNIYRPKQEAKLHRRFQGELFETALRQDMGAYDDPKFYNDFVWAMQEADTRALSVMDCTHQTVSQAVRAIIAAAVLFTIHWAMLLVVGIAVTVSFVIRRVQIKYNMQQWDEQQPYIRKREYAARTFYLQDYAKELRLSHIHGALEQDICTTINEQKKIYHRLKKIQLALRLTQVILSDFLMLSGVNILLIYHLTVSRSVSVGDFAAANTAIWQLYWSFSNFLWIFTDLREHSMFVEKYRTFLQRKPALQQGELPLPESFESLEVRQVSFSYPFGEEQVLKNINLTVKAGEKIAFVGYNGAGKSTLIKLLLRLYDPTEGEILLNGVDIRQYNIDEYRHFFGALFQDFTLFAATVGENVLTQTVDEIHREQVMQALEKAGFTERIEQMEKGIDTPLTREFYPDGVNLSGGEMQKIGIARVLASQGKVWVLDEPSSALDPDSEMQFNRQLMLQSEGKTVLFISHRLSTTRMSDRIYMLAGGELIEYGSHDQLIQHNGAYAEMFNLQAEKYRRGSAKE